MRCAPWHGAEHKRNMSSEILAFFESYRAAFNALDGDAVARLYAVPSGIASDTGYEHWSSFEPIRANMIALCALYRENGYAAARFEPRHFIDQGDRFAVADVRWYIERSADRAPWQFDTSYNLMRTQDGWRVLLCTAYSERRLNAAGSAGPP
jgi:ketosteroid isomerase-like protein